MVSNTLIESLPNEILLEIVSHGCKSKATYLSYLLINKQFYALVRYDSLRYLPIRINSLSLRPFFEFVTTLGMAEYVKYLWINGASSICSEIAQACSNLVSLACSKVVLHSLCTPLPSDKGFRHTKLTELTIFDKLDPSWYKLQQPPHNYARELFHQITHLRFHDFLSTSLTNLFPSLTHYSCTSRPDWPIELLLTPILSLPKLESISITTYFWKDQPVDNKTLSLLATDKRIRIVFFGPNEPGEFELWCGRATKSICLWTAEAPLRKIL